MSNQIYAQFRLSVDNGFRNEFSFAHYRKWGIMELWEGGKFSGPPPKVDRDTCIEVWFNWSLVGTYKSYEQAQNVLNTYLKQAPVSLHELVDFLKIK